LSAPPLHSHSLLRLPEFFSYPFLLSAPDIDRLSLFEEGPDAFAKIFGPAAQHLVAIERHPVDAIMVFDQ
jgi:hypothetical protein